MNAEDKITVVMNGRIYTYPDMTAEFETARREFPDLVIYSAWEFMRKALRELGQDSTYIRGWVYLDDEPLAYWVECRPRKNVRVPSYTILGAARYGTAVPGTDFTER